ncbi:hypothetical protein BAUJH_09820 [Escherichia coli]|uniref:hypothetical protein n=1 Tax=Escherichia coli TaxID=562 RepID=UPI0024564B90|nr:hypothetical protein [Escherichia coli]MDH4679765.1 hypothetical protein [Escherichia coli]HCB3359465.1 hypothetical protein [Escherichia coli]HDW2781774.1 hypothetical protein [Escherichia coli]HEG1854310.1 hypothetical protein [Escherichia coli]
MTKKPWERRLKDLSHLLKCCIDTYFDPELFRLNLNQFLQTARTVTFIIQKNKNQIIGYDIWYNNNVIEKWKNDPLMAWAKNSRNTIEKQGDLEMYSEAKATLISSYIEENDIEFITNESMLNIGIKKLVRLAQKKLPSYLTESSIIKSERRWVANTLKDYELLHALAIIYGRMYNCCNSLGIQINNPMGDDVISPTSFDSLFDEARRITYLKLKDYSISKLSFSMIQYDNKIIPEDIKERLKLVDKPKNITSTEELVDYTAKLAETTFLKDGYHIQTLIFYDKQFHPIDLINTTFEDQADKYIFWRYAADRAKITNAYGFIWISELWLRKASINSNKPIHTMPIIDERLQVIGIDSNNNQKCISWKIVRENEEKKPTLEILTADSKHDEKPYFMRSVLKAIGGDVNTINN